MDKKSICSFFLGLFLLWIEVQRAKAVKVKYIGCFEGKYSGTKDDLFHNERHGIVWEKYEDEFARIIKKCAEIAQEKGIKTFGVHFWGECWKDEKSRYSFLKPGICYGKAGALVGSANSSAVYEVESNEVESQACQGGRYNGASWFVPKTPDECDFCKCVSGKTNCNVVKCDYDFKCEKYKPAVEGQCCRQCACHHKGAYKQEGMEWTDRRFNVCRECRCLGADTAQCGPPKTCDPDCPNPEFIPGKCCPRCRPKAPVEPTPEIITEPPTKPKPVFPFGK